MADTTAPHGRRSRSRSGCSLLARTKGIRGVDIVAGMDYIQPSLWSHDGPFLEDPQPYGDRL